MNEKLEQLLYLVCVMAAGVVGGWLAAFVAAVACFCCIIWRETQ